VKGAPGAIFNTYAFDFRIGGSIFWGDSAMDLSMTQRLGGFSSIL
jgi:hypothetical protein